MKIHSSAKSLVLAALCTAGLSAGATAKPEFTWKNLESSIYGVTADYDGNLDDPWGLEPGEDGKTVWVANELSGTVTRYLLGGKPFEIDHKAEVVTVPTAAGSGTGSPSGLVFNHAAFGAKNSDEFLISGKPSHWLAVTLDGCVVGFNIATNPTTATPSAVIGAKVAKAYFTGCTLAFTGLTGANEAHRLYATDFAQGVVDVFDSNFAAAAPATLAANPFVDPHPVAGFKPYNIKRYSTKDHLTKSVLRVLLVAYAHDSGTVNGVPHVPVMGAGEGYINVFDTTGKYLARLVAPNTTVSEGFNIDVPYGMAIDRKNAKQADDELIVANHGSGVLLTYRPDGVFDFTNEPAAQTSPTGILERADGQGPLRFSEVRSIHFGQHVESMKAYAADEDELNDGDGTLFFDASIDGDTRGLFGRIFREE